MRGHRFAETLCRNPSSGLSQVPSPACETLSLRGVLHNCRGHCLYSCGGGLSKKSGLDKTAREMKLPDDEGGDQFIAKIRWGISHRQGPRTRRCRRFNELITLFVPQRHEFWINGKTGDPRCSLVTSQ